MRNCAYLSRIISCSTTVAFGSLAVPHALNCFSSWAASSSVAARAALSHCVQHMSQQWEWGEYLLLSRFHPTFRQTKHIFLIMFHLFCI